MISPWDGRSRTSFVLALCLAGIVASSARGEDPPQAKQATGKRLRFDEVTTLADLAGVPKSIKPRLDNVGRLAPGADFPDLWPRPLPADNARPPNPAGKNPRPEFMRVHFWAPEGAQGVVGRDDDYIARSKTPELDRTQMHVPGSLNPGKYQVVLGWAKVEPDPRSVGEFRAGEIVEASEPFPATVEEYSVTCLTPIVPRGGRVLLRIEPFGGSPRAEVEGKSVDLSTAFGPNAATHSFIVDAEIPLYKKTDLVLHFLFRNKPRTFPGLFEVVDSPPRTLRDLDAVPRRDLLARLPSPLVRSPLQTLEVVVLDPDRTVIPIEGIPLVLWAEPRGSSGVIRATRTLDSKPPDPRIPPTPNPREGYRAYTETPENLPPGKYEVILAVADPELIAGDAPNPLILASNSQEVTVGGYSASIDPTTANPGAVLKVMVEPKPNYAVLRPRVVFGPLAGMAGSPVDAVIVDETPWLTVQVPAGFQPGEARKVEVVLAGKTGTHSIPVLGGFAVPPRQLKLFGFEIRDALAAVGAVMIGIVTLGMIITAVEDRQKKRNAASRPVAVIEGTADPTTTVFVSKEDLDREREERRKAEDRVAELLAKVDDLVARLPRDTDKDGDGKGDPVPTGSLKVPDGLVEACVLDRCVLFAGFGVGAQAGQPTYRELVALVLRRAMADHPEHDWSDAHQFEQAEDIQAVAELVKRRLEPATLHHLVRGAFKRVSPAGDEYYDLLSSIPFVGVLHWGWDRNLAKAFSSRHPHQLASVDVEGFETLSRDDRFFFVHVNGDIDHPETFFFTTEDFRAAMAEGGPFSKFVRSCFSNMSILFVGTHLGVVDEFLSAGSLGASTRADEIRHYALMPRVAGREARTALHRVKFGVETIEYDATDCHEPAVEFLAKLKEAVDRRPRPTRSATRTPRLERVTLRNIGPFSHFDLDLHAAKPPVENVGAASRGSWNVLLGNNGCGKSTVLRAIALGLCGDDREARASAARLLKAGAREGTIELRLGGRVYKTSLRREGENRVWVESGVTPLQAGWWVILGFPAIRGVSSREAPDGPSPSGREKPHVRDVLPLLDGAIDWRLRNLKQWIVNIYLTSTGRDVGTKEAERAKRLLTSFFSILGAFIPGVTCELSRVDRKTWTVYVETDDGEIDIDQLSQGTGSMIGWVGTLLQRMYEIHGDSDEPESQAALVLIDEIDAHLHPEWQQVLVPVLRAKFPKLQVVATTHSPLVLLNMEAGEVAKLTRSGRRPAIEAEIDDTVRSLVREAAPELPADAVAAYAERLIHDMTEAAGPTEDDSAEPIVVEVVTESLKGMNAAQALTGPLDLVSARDHKSAVVYVLYSSLAGKEDRNETDEAMLVRLAEIVRTKVPTATETADAIKARDLIRTMYRGELRRMAAGAVGRERKLLNEVVTQIIEIGGGPSTTE